MSEKTIGISLEEYIVDVKVKAGELIILESGSWSDTMAHGVFKAKKDVDLHETVATFFEKYPDQKGNEYQLSHEKYVNYIVNELGLFEEIESRTINVGDFNELEFMIRKTGDW